MKKLIYFGKDQNLVALNYMLFSIFIASMAVGINVIAFPAVLLEHNVEAFFIGIASTNEIIFGVIASILVGKIVRKVSVAKTAVLISLAYSLVIYFIFFYKNYYLWILLSGLAGASWVSLYVIRQAWVNSLISNRNRSLILALTTTIFCAGFIIGSFIVKYFGALNHQSFVASCGLILLAAFFMILVSDTQPKEVDGEIVGFKKFINKLPGESLARFLLDFQAGVMVCLGVVFGRKIGLSTEDSGLLLAGFMASGLFDLYAGVLVKKFDRQKMIMVGFTSCLASIMVGLFFYDIYAILWTSFLFFGASCALIIIATLTIVNESFDNNQLVAANGTFQAIGSIGAVFGCLAGGSLIQTLGHYGFFVAIISANLLYFIYFVFKRKKRA